MSYASLDSTVYCRSSQSPVAAIEDYCACAAIIIGRAAAISPKVVCILVVGYRSCHLKSIIIVIEKVCYHLEVSAAGDYYLNVETV